jgi:hypothetical protein
MADALVIRGLSKRFGGLRAVQDVSFSVKENETVALIDGGEVARRSLLAGGEANELDGFARLLARHVGIPVAQERPGHDIVEHRHGAERFCDLEGAGEAVRADVVRLQADDLAPERRHRA